MANESVEKTCVLALDQGTTSSRAILFDGRGLPIATAQEEFSQHMRPGEGGVDLGIVEHDPEDIWRTQLGCARRVLAESGTRVAAVAAIGITNQRETTILWERATGRPVAPAIVWQSRVSAGICARLKARGLEDTIRRRTGLVLDPYFSATKIVHLLETIPGLRERCVAGEVLFGTVDTFLIWRLTGGRVHATDPTNASRTLLFDIDRQAWSDDLCVMFNIPPAILPEVRPSSGSFGVTDAELLGAELPITGCAGDQQAGGFAQGCLTAGDAKCTYGTGAFLLCSTGARHVESSAGLLTTLGCAVDAGPNYMLEGSVFVAGSLVGWLRDGLGIIRKAADVEPLARGVADTGGVMLVPALTGLGAPYWDPHARGLIVGITRGTTTAHIARAALEAIALSVADVVTAMERDAGDDLPRLRVDGGAAANDLLMQMQADILGRPVDRPAVLETTALGAALLAGIASGFFADPAAVAEARCVDRVFEPRVNDAARRTMLDRWHDAVGRSRGWAT
ncbi:MAG: glycerol kinase GlpK [Planctomycetia bacterium]